MNKYNHIKEKAIQLRCEGYSLPTICEMLNKGKSTVHYWIKDIDVEVNHDKSSRKPNQKLGTEAMQRKYKKLRDDAYLEGLSLYEQNKHDPLFRDFVVIYLTEGYRRNRNVVDVANSNPKILKITKKIVERFTDKTMDVTVQYYEDHNTDTLKIYWSKELDIDAQSIRMLPKTNAGKLSGRKWNSQYGVTSIRWSDTYLRSKIQAWMDCLQAEWA